ncbi:hypothetical protein AQUCO_00200980v1 [Aquilegia coerulea]|uniref:Uncharacterized protein n=1 Tax=Aquilegia coerulea TaxID=218851 RepID=A0A2G5F5V9_AQUCA|nr:hypothetical protein AQUCO_00200980v1 [Aquilegia coerulea]
MGPLIYMVTDLLNIAARSSSNQSPLSLENPLSFSRRRRRRKVLNFHYLSLSTHICLLGFCFSSNVYYSLSIQPRLAFSSNFKVLTLI